MKNLQNMFGSLLFPKRAVKLAEAPSPEEHYSQAEESAEQAKKSLPAVSNATLEFKRGDTLSRILMDFYKDNGVTDSNVAKNYALTVSAKLTQAAKDQSIEGFNVNLFHTGDSITFSENGARLSVSYNGGETNFDLSLEREHTGDQVPETRAALEGTRLEVFVDACKTGIVFDVAKVLGYNWKDAADKEEFVGKTRTLGLTDEKVQELVPGASGSAQINSAICKFLLELARGDNALTIFDQLRKGGDMADWEEDKGDLGAIPEEMQGKPALAEEGAVEMTEGGAPAPAAEETPEERDRRLTEEYSDKYQDGAPVMSLDELEEHMEESGAEASSLPEGLSVDDEEISEEAPAAPTRTVAEPASPPSSPEDEVRQPGDASPVETVVAHGGLESLDKLSEQDYRNFLNARWEVAMVEAREAVHKVLPEATVTSTKVEGNDVNRRINIEWKGFSTILEVQALSLSGERTVGFIDADGEDKANETASIEAALADMGAPKGAGPEALDKPRTVSILYEGKHYTRPRGAAAIAAAKMKETYSPSIEAVEHEDIDGNGEVHSMDDLKKNEYDNYYLPYLWRKQMGSIERTVEAVNKKVPNANVEVSYQDIDFEKVPKPNGRSKEVTLRRGNQEVVILFRHPANRVRQFNQGEHVGIKIKGQPKTYLDPIDAVGAALEQLGVTEIVEGTPAPEPVAEAAPTESNESGVETQADTWEVALAAARESVGPEITIEEQTVSGRPAKRGAHTVTLSLGDKKATVTVAPKGFFGKVEGFKDDSTAKFDCVQAKGEYISFQDAIDGAATYLRESETPVEPAETPAPAPAEEPSEDAGGSSAVV